MAFMSRLKVGEERVWLLRWAAIAFAVNKFLVVAITVAGSREQWGPLSPLGFLDYVFIRNFRYFDSHWFTEIAAHGYTVKSTAFFPLYPLVIRGVSELLHVSPLAAGVLISNVAFFFGLYFFLRLARLDLDRTGAVRTLFLLALFPTAFFFSSAYTEALFLLLAALALYSMRARRWGRAGGYSALAAITRNTGIALGLPFLIEYWESWREKKKTLLEAEETGVDEPAGSVAAGGSGAGSVAQLIGSLGGRCGSF